jgi:hypothetical protein
MPSFQKASLALVTAPCTHPPSLAALYPVLNAKLEEAAGWVCRRAGQAISSAKLCSRHHVQQGRKVLLGILWVKVRQNASKTQV